MINTHAQTHTPEKNPNKKKVLKCSLFPLYITLDLLGVMTLCCESQMGDSEGELKTEHLLGVSGYQMSIPAASRLCLACLAIRQLETLAVMLACICANKCPKVTPKPDYTLDKQWKCKPNFCFPE